MKGPDVKLTRNHMTLALVAALALIAITALAGYPLTSYAPPEVLAALAAAGGMPIAMSGEVTLLEVKKVLEDQGRTFEEFKKANDELIKAKAEGKAVADLEVKVAKLSEALDKFADLKEAAA